MAKNTDNTETKDQNQRSVAERENTSAEASNENLSPKVKEIINITRTLVILVGGTGAECGIELAKKMRAAGIRCGEVIPVTDEQGVVVDIVLFDTNQDEYLPGISTTEPAKLMNNVGVHGCLIPYQPNGEMLFRQLKLDEKYTPNTPSKLDNQGSQADPRIGDQKLFLALRNKQDPNNPRNVISGIVGHWKDSDQLLLRDNMIKVNIVHGTHGGTGAPIAPVIAAIANDVIKTRIDQEPKITMFAMTSESSEIDNKMQLDPIASRKRSFNSLFTLMYMNYYSRIGRIELADNTFLDNKMGVIYVLGGESETTKVRDNGGHYSPSKMCAKYILEQILNRDATASILNNIPIELPEPSLKNNNKPLKRFSYVGSSAIVSDIPRPVFDTMKRKQFYPQIVGLDKDTVNPELVQGQVDLTLKSDFVSKFGQSIRLPELRAGQLAEAEEAPKKVENVFRNFDGMFRDLEIKVREKLAEDLTGLTGKIREKTPELMNEEGLQTAMKFLESIAVLIEGLKTQVEKDKKLDKDKIEAAKTAAKDLVIKIRDTRIPFFNIPIWNNREKKLKQIGIDVNQLCSAADKYAKTACEAAVRSNITDDLINPLSEAVRKFLNAVGEKLRAAQAVYDEIKPERDPKDFEGVCFDQTIKVGDKIKFNVDVKESRKRLTEWNAADFEKLVRSIRAATEELGMLTQITRNKMEIASERAKPLYRPVDHGAETSSIKMVSIPKSSNVQLDKNGKIKHEFVGIPGSFTEYLLPEENDVRFTCEVHRETLLNNKWFIYWLKEAIGLSPREREQHCKYEGDLMKILPPFAEDYATMLFNQSGRRDGDVIDCTGADCGIKFHRNNKEVEKKICKCPGCRKLDSGLAEK
ncbi:hypothetical protein HZA39_00345 [Candidatus Peregrinibacteria bacterium]|nr:hypothetical protein [Candidatus Peregrinibacteria bacterium]